MIGLIKKDFLILKSNLKVFLIVVAISIFWGLQGNIENALFILPIMVVMIFLSTFSYDEVSNWNTYAISLPNGRRNVIKAKYISSIILLLITFIIMLVIAIFTIKTGSNNMTQSMIISDLIGGSIGAIISISLLYPFMIKYGAINGRIIVFAFIMGIGGIGYILPKIVKLSYITNFIDSLGNRVYLYIFILVVLILLGSYLISNKIYTSKEF